MIEEALILAGGFGTRLKGVLGDLPKPLAPVAGKPILARLLDQLADAGVKRAVLCTGYNAAKVEETFGAQYGDIELSYSVEDEPLGTGGALRLGFEQCSSERVFALNGDSYVHADLADFAAWAGERNAIVGVQMEDPGRYGKLEVEEDRLREFREKREGEPTGYINAGVYLLSAELLNSIPTGQQISLEREVFPKWLDKGLYFWKSDSPFLDIGTPESLAAADEFFRRLDHE